MEKIMIIPGIIYLVGVAISIILNKFFWPIDDAGVLRRLSLALAWPVIVFLYCLAVPVALWIMIRDFRAGE